METTISSNNMKESEEKCMHCNSNLKKTHKYILCNICLKNDDITLTPTKIKKKYNLKDNDLTTLELIKRRYYLPDVIKLSEKLNREKKLREEEKKQRLAELKIKRIIFIDDYFKDKPEKYVNFVNNSPSLISYYNGAFTDEEILQKINKEYEDHEIKINIKSIRRDDIKSVIEKHEMKDYAFYQSKLQCRIEEYVNNEELSLVEYFLKIQTEYTRIKELYEALAIYNLTPRFDSYLCSTYAKYGLSGFENGTNDMGNIKSVKDIANIMYAMDFLYNFTEYQKELDKIHKNKYMFRYETEALATIAKRTAIKKWLNMGNDVSKLPERLQRFTQ